MSWTILEDRSILQDPLMDFMQTLRTVDWFRLMTLAKFHL